jgi:predicted nuclease of predicted toxin-antitoxin system
MKILLDECVPWPLQKLLPAHECASVQKQGWGGIKNGELLSLAQTNFDIFITSDQNLRYQQNLTGYRISVLELSTNDLRRIRAAAGIILSAVNTLKPGTYRRLQIP